jgi:hypothetical protein
MPRTLEFALCPPRPSTDPWRSAAARGRRDWRGLGRSHADLARRTRRAARRARRCAPHCARAVEIHDRLWETLETAEDKETVQAPYLSVSAWMEHRGALARASPTMNGQRSRVYRPLMIEQVGSGTKWSTKQMTDLVTTSDRALRVFEKRWKLYLPGDSLRAFDVASRRYGLDDLLGGPADP